MKISAQEEYGLRCLLHLAREADAEGFTIQQIAEAERLSIPYAGKLLRLLRLAGFVTSRPGYHSGGYRLSRPASEIRLGEVLRALGEPLFEDPGYCERHASPDGGGACVHSDDCTLRAIWQTLEQWMRHFLDQFTLADLLRGQGQIAERLHAHRPAEPLGPPGELLTLGPAIRG